MNQELMRKVAQKEVLAVLTDEAGNPLRANTVYCLKVDGTLSWFQDLPAPATA